MKKLNLLIFPLLIAMMTACGRSGGNNNGSSQGGGSSGGSTDTGGDTSERTKNQKYNFYIDYWHSDEPMKVVEWYTGVPLGECPEECRLTSSDATDPAFTTFLGWSQYSSSIDGSKLWDFSTGTSMNRTVNLYGIWVSAQKRSFI